MEMIPSLIRSPSHTPFTIGISVEPKINVIWCFALSTNMIGSCLLQYGYSCKLENNCCSVYMSKTLYGHTPNENALLDLDCGDTHSHNIEAKRCKVNNDSATYLWHCRLGHIGVKRMKKSMLMDFWNHLIMNQLMLANRASWAR